MAGIIAAILVFDDSEANWPLWVLLLGIAGSLGFKAVTTLWPVFTRWSEEKRSRTWPTVPGVIDIAVVTKVVESAGRGGQIITYEALLTYTYHNPDLQTGDYNRTFGDEGEAKDWVDSCKGRTVTIHVDPADPAHSVLRTEDLESVVALSS